MLKLLLWIVILLLVVLFVAFNVDPKVTVHLLPGISLEGIPLALVIIFSFVLGLLLGLLLVYPKLLKAKLQIYQLERKTKDIKAPESEEIKSEG